MSRGHHIHNAAFRSDAARDLLGIGTAGRVDLVVFYELVLSVMLDNGEDHRAETTHDGHVSLSRLRGPPGALIRTTSFNVRIR